MLLNFDFDGVVIDSLDRLVQQCCDAQRDIDDGRCPTKDDFRTIQNLTFDELGLLLGMSQRNAARYEEAVHARQAQDGSTCALFAGMQDAFLALAERHTITIITASDSAAVEAEASRLGLGWPTVAKVLGPNLAKTKCDRILQSCKAFHASPRDTYMIGDAMSDIRQGKAAGVNTIAVTWGYQDRELLAQERPTHLVDSPEELVRLL